MFLKIDMRRLTRLFRPPRDPLSRRARGNWMVTTVMSEIPLDSLRGSRDTVRLGGGGKAYVLRAHVVRGPSAKVILEPHETELPGRLGVRMLRAIDKWAADKHNLRPEGGKRVTRSGHRIYISYRK